MTPLTKEDIPATVNSVEKLAVWCAEVLQNLYPDVKYNEFTDDDDNPVSRRCIEANKFFYIAIDPGQWRHSSRLSVRLSNQHQIRGKIWEHALSLGETEIPSGMRI